MVLLTSSGRTLRYRVQGTVVNLKLYENRKDRQYSVKTGSGSNVSPFRRSKKLYRNLSKIRSRERKLVSSKPVQRRTTRSGPKEVDSSMKINPSHLFAVEVNRGDCRPQPIKNNVSPTGHVTLLKWSLGPETGDLRSP